MPFNDDACKERHTGIKAKLDEHDKLLESHSKDINEMKADNKELKTEVKNLVKSVDGLVSTLKWVLGFFITAFVGFFFVAAQKGLIK